MRRQRPLSFAQRIAGLGDELRGTIRFPAVDRPDRQPARSDGATAGGQADLACFVRGVELTPNRVAEIGELVAAGVQLPDRRYTSAGSGWRAAVGRNRTFISRSAARFRRCTSSAT